LIEATFKGSSVCRETTISVLLFTLAAPFGRISFGLLRIRDLAD
jgi:hypothetical protein